MGKVIHFEISADDPERAVRFYNEVFGWDIKRWGDQDYWLVMTGDRKSPGIDGAIQPRTGLKQSVVNTIVVDSIEETIELIHKAGGKIVAPRMEIPTVGSLVYFSDTEGNIHGALQPYDPNMR